MRTSVEPRSITSSPSTTIRPVFRSRMRLRSAHLRGPTRTPPRPQDVTALRLALSERPRTAHLRMATFKMKSTSPSPRIRSGFRMASTLSISCTPQQASANAPARVLTATRNASPSVRAWEPAKIRCFVPTTRSSMDRPLQGSIPTCPLHPMEAAIRHLLLPPHFQTARPLTSCSALHRTK